MTRPAATLPPPVGGDLGAVAAAHPLAVGAGLSVLAQGGGAADAAVAAQAVLGVVMPQACGIGGDALFLVADPEGRVTAVNGTGRAGAAALDPRDSDAAGATVTVPGQVAAWEEVLERWGHLPLEVVLAPAVRLAGEGIVVGASLRGAIDAQRPRLQAGGAADWALLDAPVGSRPPQTSLAATLHRIGREGPSAFYGGALARQLCEAVARAGGSLTEDDLSAHDTVVGPPLSVAWDGGIVHVQPPVTQGVLLAMALRWLEEHGVHPDDSDHVGVEVTEAVFGFRDRIAADGVALLEQPLEVDRERAGGRGGPRAYLHTAGVAVADQAGVVVSSLASVFDDFGSGCFVAPGGFALNNRAEGFTGGPNTFTAGARPVHTLAPAMMERDGDVLALATPGADGQVQTLLQVLCQVRWHGAALEEAVDAPRWRSEGGRLLMEASHQRAEALRTRGHDVVVLPDGDDRFGSVVAAGRGGGAPYAVADWRRHAATGAV